MRFLGFCWLVLILALGGLSIHAAPTKSVAPKRITPNRITPSKTSAKKISATKVSLTKAKSTIKRSPAIKSSVTQKTAKRPAKRRYTSKSMRRPPARRGQVAPAEDRIRDIQAALQERGYFNESPNGKWDDSSVAALKRFQEEQNLKPDGKLGSLSLIALGLGPRRGSASPASAISSPPASTVSAPAESPQAPR